MSRGTSAGVPARRSRGAPPPAPLRSARLLAEGLGQAQFTPHGAHQRVRLLEHLGPLVGPGLAERLHDPAEGGHPLALDWWEVGPGVEGAPVGRAEDRHGPAARPGQGLGGRHVDGVEIGSLLAVDLHRNERLRQVSRRVGILEALVRHDVAPVARGVPDGHEEGLVLVAGPLQGLVPPGEPLHRVVGVLAEIRARLVGQMVHGSDATAPSPGGGTPAGPCKAQAMELELNGKTALITGASRGIGLAMATALRRSRRQRHDHLPQGGRPRRGGGRSRRRGAPAKSRWPGPPPTSASPRTPSPVWPRTLARFGRLDILVNNAGTNPYFGPMIDIDVVRAQKTFEVNQLAVLVWTAAAVKAGLRGSVINVASIGGLGVEPGIGWYNVTKAAVLHITRQLAFELAPDIRVNALGARPGEDEVGGRALGDGRGADRCPHPAAPAGGPGRHRDRCSLSGLRCRLVDHWPDFRD